MQTSCLALFVLVWAADPIFALPAAIEPVGTQVEEIVPTARFFAIASTVTLTSTITEVQTLLAAKSCVRFVPGLTPCPASLISAPQSTSPSAQFTSTLNKPGANIVLGQLLPGNGNAILKPVLPGFLQPFQPFVDVMIQADNPDEESDGKRREKRKVQAVRLSPSATVYIETTEEPVSAFGTNNNGLLQDDNLVQPSISSMQNDPEIGEYEIIGMSANCGALRNLLPSQVTLVKIATETVTTTSRVTSYFPGNGPRQTASFVIGGCIPVNPPINLPECPA